MPRRHAYRLQERRRRGGSWTTVEKVWDERAAIRFGDMLARTTPAFELQVVQGRDVVERWVLRDKPVTVPETPVKEGR